MEITFQWTPRAVRGLKSVVEYLEATWTEKEIKKLERNLQSFLDRIVTNPEISNVSREKFSVQNYFSSINMMVKNKNNTITFWLVSVFNLFFTGLLTITSFFEYYIIDVKKDIDNYPFGAEGPVAGIEYYKTAEIYAKHMLTTSLISSLLFFLTVYFISKQKTIGLLIVLTFIIGYMFYNIMGQIY